MPDSELENLVAKVDKVYTSFNNDPDIDRNAASTIRQNNNLSRLTSFARAFVDLPPFLMNHNLTADKIEFYKKLHFLLNLSDYVDKLISNIREKRSFYARVLQDLKKDLDRLKTEFSSEIEELNVFHDLEKQESKIDRDKIYVVLESIEQIHARYIVNPGIFRKHDNPRLIAKLAGELIDIRTIRTVDRVKGLAKLCEIKMCEHLKAIGIQAKDLNNLTQQQMQAGRKRSNYFLLLEEARNDLHDALGIPFTYYPRRILNADDLGGRIKRLLEKPKAENQDRAELKIKTKHKEELYDLLDVLTVLDQHRENNFLIVSSMVDNLYNEYLKNNPDKTRYNVSKDHKYFYFIKWLKNDLDQFKKQLPAQDQEKKEEKQERNSRSFIERIKKIEEEYKREGGRDPKHLESLSALVRYAKRLDGSSALTDNQKEHLLQARISTLHQQFLQDDDSASQRYSALLNREVHRQAAAAANRQPQVKAGQTLYYIPKSNEQLIVNADQLLANATQLWERLHQAQPLKEGILGRLQDRDRHDDLSKLRNLALGPGSTLEKLSAVFDEVERQRKAYPDSKNKTYSALLEEIAREIYNIKNEIQAL